MGRRQTERRLSDAFREAYETAGVSQTRIAEATGVDQPRVSKWARGERDVPLEKLPIIDALCGQPAGHVLRLAGYVDDDAVDVAAAIQRDPDLSDADKDALIGMYRMFLGRARNPRPAVRLRPEQEEIDSLVPNLDDEDERTLWEDTGLPERERRKLIAQYRLIWAAHNAHSAGETEPASG